MTVMDRPLDERLLHEMSFGGIVANDGNRQMLETLVERGLAHLVNRPSKEPDSRPLSPVYCLTPDGRKALLAGHD